MKAAVSVDYRCLRLLESSSGATLYTRQCQGSMRRSAGALECDTCGRVAALEPVA